MIMGLIGKPDWLFPAELLRVVDGDTAVFRMDLGFRTYRQESIRFKDIDTPEKAPRKEGRSGASIIAEKEAALMAARFTQAQLAGAEIRIQTFSDKQTFNRYVGAVWYRPDKSGIWLNLSEELWKAGHSKEAFFEKYGK